MMFWHGVANDCGLMDRRSVSHVACNDYAKWDIQGQSSHKSLAVQMRMSLEVLNTLRMHVHAISSFL